METAQAMVDAAAKAAGYNVGPVYHGTEQKGLTEFYGGWWSDTKKVTREFGSQRYSAYLKGPLADGDTLRELYKKFNGTDIDADSDGSLADSEIADVAMSGGPFSRYVEDAGYQGIEVWDESNAETGMAYSVFNPNQIKSADPITRDADGNVIPLSQRFNDASPDIRYAKPVAPGRISEADGRAIRKLESDGHTIPLNRETTLRKHIEDDLRIYKDTDSRRPKAASVTIEDFEASSISQSEYPLARVVLDNGGVIYLPIRVSDHPQVSSNAPRSYAIDIRGKPQLLLRTKKGRAEVAARVLSHPGIWDEIYDTYRDQEAFYNELSADQRAIYNQKPQAESPDPSADAITRPLSLPAPPRTPGAHMASITQQGARMRQGTSVRKASGLPSARDVSSDTGALVRDLFMGRHDLLDRLIPGTKRLIQENRLDAGFASAAVRSMMDRIRKRIEGSFGTPRFWNVRRRQRMSRFLSELLPAASRLHATGYTATGDLQFADFNRPVGFISNEEMTAAGLAEGQTVPLPGSPTGQMVEIGPLAPERGGHILTEFMPASAQDVIFDQFTARFPEGAWVLEEFLSPGMEDAREIGPGGTSVPAFNRGSLLNYLNDDWPPALAAMFTAQPLPPVAMTEGWTPDIARQRTAAAFLGTILRNMLASVRKARTGERVESGDLRDLLDGFEITAFEAQMEKNRLIERNRLINAAARSAPPPATGAREFFNRWTPMDDLIIGTLRSYVLARKADKKLIPTKGKPLSPQQRALATRLMGDGVRFWGTDAAIPRRIYQEFLSADARDTVTNGLLRAIDWLVQRYVTGLLFNLGTLVVNITSNPVLKQMLGMNRLAYALTSAMHGDWSATKLGAYEWAHLMRGVAVDKFPMLQKRILSALPAEIYDDATTWSQVEAVDPLKSAWEEVKDLNPGAAFLKTVRYGEVDQSAKLGVHYALLRARASMAANKAGVRGAARRAFVRDWMDNARTKHRKDVEETYQMTMDAMLDFSGDAPAIIDPAQSIFNPGGIPGQIEKVVKRGTFSLYRFKAAMARYGYRNTVGSAKTLFGMAVPAEQRAQAAANLLTLAALGALGHLIVGVGEGEDDDPLVGRKYDEYGRMLSEAVRTGDRVNITRAGRIIAAWLRRHGVPIKEDGTVEPGTTEEDVWIKASKLPLFSSAILMGRLSRGEVDNDALSDAWAIFYDEMLPTGPLIRLSPAYDINPYDKGKSYGVVATDQLLDLLTAPVLPSRLREGIGRVVDPQFRLLKPEPEIRYDPGIKEVIKANIPGLSRGLPVAADYQMQSPMLFSAALWRKNQLAAIAGDKEASASEKDRRAAAVAAEFPAMIEHERSQREILERFGIDPHLLKREKTGTPWPADLATLEKRGVGMESVFTGTEQRKSEGAIKTYPRIVYPNPAQVTRKTGGDYLWSELTGVNAKRVERGALSREVQERKNEGVRRAKSEAEEMAARKTVSARAKIEQARKAAGKPSYP